MPLHSYRWVDDQLRSLEAQNLRRTRRIRQSPQAAAIRIDNQDVLNFAANDYLGLAAQLGSRAASLPDGGWGSGASPMISGRSSDHAQLERELATFEGTEAALVFSSGYAANVGTITALVGKPDVIFSDEMNHASIIDGCRLAGARIVIYPHADAGALGKALETGSQDFRRRLIVTDTLFSMEGDAPPLAELAELAAKYDAMLLVDEAHATGVFGAKGRGLVEQFHLEESFPVRIGTLSKALGSMGGFAVGPQAIMEWIAHAARSYFFSTAPPDALVRVNCEALRIVQNEPERRRVLLERATQLRSQLMEIGCDIGRSISQIVPVILGDAGRAIEVSARLLERGVFVPAIRPPSVPEGKSLLRISLSCRHTSEDIERLVRAIADMMQEEKTEPRRREAREGDS